MQNSLASYGVGRKLLQFVVVGIENLVQFLRRTLCLCQLLFAHRNSDSIANSIFTSHDSDVVDSIHLQTSTASHGGNDNREEGIESMHPPSAAFSGDINSNAWYHGQQGQLLLTVSYDSITK